MLSRHLSTFSNAYFESKCIEKEKILSLNELRKKITLNFVSQTEEVVVVTLLGKNGKLIYSGIVYHGNFNSVDSYTRKIIELIVLYNASSVIISHNHLNGLLLPSKDDIYSFEKLNIVLKSMNVDFLDNLIISDDECLSFKKIKLMK
ncbi:MAG: JAB domain-containing protein [Clostridia bacterium]|nr:JAB domain-containing protein [Clostridia bacterium]